MDTPGNSLVAEAVATAATDGAAPRFVSSALNYATGEMSIVFSEAIDATPGTNVDLTKIHVRDASGFPDTPDDLNELGPAVITEADSSTLSLTLTGTQAIGLRDTSGVSGGDGDANILDLDAAAVQDLNGLTNELANHSDLLIVEASDAALTGVSVTPSNSTVSQITSFTIALTNVNPIPANGKIQIVFPTQFNILSADNQVATNLVGIDGTLTASVTGLTMTLSRTGGTDVATATDVSFKIAGGLNGATAGATDTFIVRTQDNSSVNLDEKLDVASVTLAAVIAPVVIAPVAVTTSGGGGGGGGGYTRSTTPPADSNDRTSTISSTFSSIVNREKTYTRPIQVSTNLITNDAIERIKTVELTGETGVMTIQPNKESTLWVRIPENTTLTAATEWDGKINPPLTYSTTKVSILGGVILDSNEKLYRENVLQVIKVGSTKVPLSFSNKVAFEVPLEKGEEGDEVNVYSSPYGRDWTFVDTAEIRDGKVNFEADHFSYFAIESADSLHSSAPLSRFIDKMFTDISGHWAEDYINSIAERGVVNGKSEGIFAPNDLITRAEMTKVAVNALGFDVPASVDGAPFTDVDMDAWYSSYIKVAKENGIVQGMGSEFKPNDPVTRAAALKILIEAAGFADVFENYDTNYASKDGWWYVGFEDALIDEW
ncbi:S-layer homology domain-containing protein, partial [Candidatus Pacearchaeota archaeon]|nr:S-layer homology domain-containing protein [Candidatus Pacearchaeota archaeon]